MTIQNRLASPEFKFLETDPQVLKLYSTKQIDQRAKLHPIMSKVLVAFNWGSFAVALSHGDRGSASRNFAMAVFILVRGAPERNRTLAAMMS